MTGYHEDLHETALRDYHTAFLSDTASEFSARIRKSIIRERRALSSISQNTKESQARLSLYRSTLHQLRYWLETSSESKKQLLNKAWNNAKRALSLFDATRHYAEYVSTFNQFAFAATLGVMYESSYSSRVKRCREAVAIARRAASLASSLTNSAETATTFAKTALFLDGMGDEVAEPGKRSEHDLEGLRYWKNALNKSREAALLAVAGPPTGFYRILNEEEALPVSREALENARKKGDVFAIAWLADQMGARTYWKARREADPHEGVRLVKEALAFAEEAAQKYEQVNFTGPNDGVLWAHSPYTEYFWILAELQADPSQRRLLLEKSMSSTPELFSLAKRSGYSEIMFYAHHVTAKTAISLAEIETRPRQKRSLLSVALNHRKNAIRIGKSHIPPDHWNRALNLRYLADVQIKLADLKQNLLARRRLLMEAVKNKEQGLAIGTKYVRSLAKEESHLLRTPLGAYYRGHGDLLVQMYRQTGGESWLRRAAAAYTSAAAWLKNTPMHGARAESYWSSGQCFMDLRGHSLAAENFQLASREYSTAAEKTPHLQHLYRDYSRYLRAWSRIEKARDHHARVELDLSANYYRDAANILRATERWNALAIHYSATARLELAEKYGRDGNSQEAMRAFEEAANGFHKSKASLQTLLTTLDQRSEQDMITRLAEPQREEYCRARIMVEQAKIAESKGDYLSGSEKYGLAAEKFSHVSKITSSVAEKREAQFLSHLARAWQLSSRAQLKNSIELLQQARLLFHRARVEAFDQNTTLLASGHEHFCKALMASWEASDSTDPALYLSAASDLDVSANFFSAAGHQTAADHATATKMLLEASLQIAKGNKQNNQRRRAAHFESAAKLLGESARAFERAGQQARKSHTLDLLDKVKIEWELASQLSEILKVAKTTTTSLALPISVQGEEIAAGLERFENPDIEATISTSTKDPESLLDMEIRLTNVGNQPIRMTRIDDVSPDWVEVSSNSEGWNMKGKSLETQPRRVSPLKMETLNLRLSYKTNRGLFRIRPRITVIDEKGLPREIVLNQKIITTSRIMDYLASAFSKDNNDQRLTLNHCGWRTLMEVVNAVKVPRSYVYGEPRYGRAFGRQLDALMKASLVESRIFPGERGRGGDIVKVRVRYDNDEIRRLVDYSSKTQTP